MKIKAVLRKAVKLDLFFNDEKVVKNKPVFQKSVIDGHIEGAYYTSSYDDNDLEAYLEFWYKFSMGLLYVINYRTPGVDDIPIKLELQQAEAFDVKEDTKQLQTGKPYYLLTAEEMEGPYFLNSKTNVLELKDFLETKILYVIAKSKKVELFINKEVA